MDTGSNISNQPGGPYQTGPIGGVSADPSTDTTLQTGHSSHDTLSKSDLEALAAMVLFSNIPLLPQPSYSNPDDSINGISGISSSSFSMQITAKMDEIKSNILESWSKNLEEIAEQTRNELKSPRFLAWQEQHSPDYVVKMESQSSVKGLTSFQSYLNSLAPTDRLEEMNMNQEHMLRVGLINGLENYQKSTANNSTAAAEALPFVAAAMIVGSTFIAHAIPKGMIGPVIDPQSQFMQNSINLFVPLIPSDARAELGLLGALFASVAFNMAAASNLIGKAKGENVGDHELAVNYAKNVINLMVNGVLSSFVVGSMVDKMEGSNKMTDARKQELASTIKIAVMANAIGALYKADTKWITGKEFLDLIDGKLKLHGLDKDGKETTLLHKDLVAELKKLLPLMNAELGNLSPKERAKVRSALSEYMDSNPDYNKMFDVNKSLSSIFQTTPYQPLSDK